MKLTNKFFIFLVLILIFSISSVGASENDLAHGDDLNYGSSNMNTVLSEENSNLLDNGILIEEPSLTDLKDIIEDSSFTDLENVISNSVEEELILENNYSFEESKDIASGVKINRSITIDGKGHTINGLNESRLLIVSDANLNLKNIIFINGFTNEYGAGIHLNNSNLTLTNCTFSFNCANLGGSAIYSSYSTVNLTDCTFSFNGVEDLYVLGGAFHALESNVTIDNSSFFNNSADEGGALYLFNSSLSLYDSNFYNNLARWYGGSLWAEAEVRINGSQFYNNKAGYKGGAFHSSYSYDGNSLALINNFYIFNNVAEYGAAISSSNANFIKIYNSEIYGNNASYGAVISRLSRQGMEICDSKIYNNSAKNGTVLYSLTGGATLFKNNIIENNIGETGTVYYIVSGRVDNVTRNYKFNFLNCSIKNNNMIKGLFYSYFDYLLINDSTITYDDACYNDTVVYVMEIGNFFNNNNWWGVENPNFDVLVYIGKPSDSANNLQDSIGIEDSSNECCSSVIQIDNESFPFTFRVDSSSQLCVMIDNHDGNVLQYKGDETFFWHAFFSENGWAFGNGGRDNPYVSERLEAFAKIMINENRIIEEFINLACDLKESVGYGHFLVKSPNGTYAFADYFSTVGRTIGNGTLNPG